MAKRADTEKEPSLATLLTLLGIFSAVWFGLLKILISLIQRNGELASESSSLLAWVVLFFSYHIFSYLLSIVKAIYYETSLSRWPEISITKLNQKKKEANHIVMNDWAINLFLIVPTLLLTVYGQTFGNWGYVVGIVLTAALFFEWLFIVVNPLLKRTYQIRSWTDFKTFCKQSVNGSTLRQATKQGVLGTVSLILYCVTVIALTSGVDVKMDKDVYRVNEIAIVQIEPYGLIPPEVLYVFYSNTDELVYNGTAEPFRRAFRVVQVPPAGAQFNLTDRSYNSHISIITSYAYIGGVSYLGERYLVRLPVYTPAERSDMITPSPNSQNETNVEHNSTSNETSKINQTTNSTLASA